MSDIVWQPVTVQLSALVPWDRNPKTISKTHAKRMLDLWQRLGQFQTIAIGPAGEVYDGHQRLSVLKAAHGPRFEVTALQADRALTEKEREELTVAAHVGTTGQFSWDELSSWDAGDLQTWGFDAELLQDWNAGAAALATMLESAQDTPPDDPGAQIDRAEELREKWQTAPGQMWQLGEHRVICGDCTDATVVARVMGGERAGMVVVDPPYGIDYNRHVPNPKHENLMNDDSPQPALLLSQIPDSEAWYVWTRWDVLAQWMAAIPLPVRNVIVWDKQSNGMGDLTTTYAPSWEACIFASKPRHKLSGSRDRDVWASPRPESTDHLTPKPIDLICRCVEKSSSFGDLVFDGFLGSGTTLIACERLNRRCRGVEISPAYVAVTLQRWADITGRDPVLVD